LKLLDVIRFSAPIIRVFNRCAFHSCQRYIDLFFRRGVLLNFNFVGSISKKVKNVSQHAGVSLEYFGILATQASNGSEFLILNIKDFCESPTSSAKYISLIGRVSALGTLISGMSHFGCSSV